MIEIKIAKTLKRMGVPANLQGSSYLRHAIKIALENADVLRMMTKKLYPAVSRHFDTTPTRVERSIRHAKEVAWSRGDVDFFREVFGYSVSIDRVPTNSEFICGIVDWLEMSEITEGE